MPTKISFQIDRAKLERDLKKQIDLEVKKAMNSLTNTDLQEVGESAIAEMKVQISKGVSPIQGWGKFPAYKWVGKGKALLAKASKLKGPGNKSRRKKLRAQAGSLSSKYPYSVMGQYPSKKTTPVNLFLSGKFLKALKAQADGRNGLTRRLYIGFFQKWAERIEDGHRTGGIKGVNDQPQRPIIPIDNESFTAVVYQKIISKAAEIIRKRFSR